ncbi:MAG: cytochrome b/b6 domain-containing protein [Caenibius sp.]
MKRHALPTRFWHWLNLWCVVVLFMSGLNISNAHPRLYWGEWGFAAEQAWLHLPRYPGWMTIPGHYSLAEARLWHFLAAWPFALGLFAFLIVSLFNGHVWRDIIASRSEWRWSAIKADIAEHLRLNFTHEGAKFNFLQKLAYGAILFIALPVMIGTGITLSPAMNANWPGLLDLFGGRQSARSIHFIMAWGLFGFLVLHVTLVILSGPFRQMRDMVTGGSA